MTTRKTKLWQEMQSKMTLAKLGDHTIANAAADYMVATGRITKEPELWYRLKLALRHRIEMITDAIGSGKTLREQLAQYQGEYKAKLQELEASVKAKDARIKWDLAQQDELHRELQKARFAVYAERDEETREATAETTEPLG